MDSNLPITALYSTRPISDADHIPPDGLKCPACFSLCCPVDLKLKKSPQRGALVSVQLCAKFTFCHYILP